VCEVVAVADSAECSSSHAVLRWKWPQATLCRTCVRDVVLAVAHSDCMWHISNMVFANIVFA
jgi:hypothetical protein